MLGIFVKGPWYSTFITAKYEYSTQNSFSVKPKFAGKCGQSPRSTLLAGYVKSRDCAFCYSFNELGVTQMGERRHFY